MTILVIADIFQNTLQNSTLSCLTAAKNIGGDIHVLVACSDKTSIETQLATYGDHIQKIIFAVDSKLENPVAEDFTDIVQTLDLGQYSHILAASSTTGKNILPRIAAHLDVMQISDISAVIDENTFKRPIYAGNLIATYKSNDPTKVITVRATSFDKAVANGAVTDIEDMPVSLSDNGSSFKTLTQSESERPDLTSANVVVSGGRALQSSENFKIIENLADQLGGAVGASRAAVDAGYVPNDYQVGQTGKIVAPDLYIAIGISGAIQHLAGMKESKVIVAINKDEDAPIFQVADYGLVGDLFDIVPKLSEELTSRGLSKAA